MTRRVQLAILVATFAALLGCNRASPDAVAKRMIVMGVDGMDPNFVEAHWEELPNLNRLRRQGEFKRLATSIPPQSPVAWSSLITGMDPGGHGIFDFIHRNPANRMPFSSMAEISEPAHALTLGPFVLPLSKGQVRTLRKGPAFWQLLAEHEVPTTVVRMPANFPPAACKARTLAGMGTPDLQGTFGTFTFFTDDPQEGTRDVTGGHIVDVQLQGYRAVLSIEGPVNMLRKERPRSSVPLIVNIDPIEPVARVESGEEIIVLREGEWSGWLRAQFPLIPGVKTAGMFRVYLQKVRPYFRLYLSPINIDPAAPELPISTPDSYSAELAAAVGPFYTQGIAEDTSALRAGVFEREEFLTQSRQVQSDSLRAFRYELDRFHGGLLFFYFSSVDQNSHILWGKYDQELLGTYQAIDDAVGAAMEKIDDGNLVVLSDHGFSSFDRAVHLNTWLQRQGFLALDDPSNMGDQELFAHVDWSRTQAYAFGLNGLYLNLAGREHGGIVSPSDSGAVMKKLTDQLRSFRDPKTGQAVVDTVYVPRDVFHGGALEYAPDLIIGFRPGYRASWQTALGAIPKLTIEDNTEAWIADHCVAAKYVPGVLFSNRKSRVAEPQLVDLTATILKEFSIRPAASMIGQAIF